MSTWWQVKAHALLASPAALANGVFAIDERVRAALGEPDATERALIERCLLDAFDSQALAGAGGVPATAQLRNPLSAEPQSETSYSHEQLRDQHQLLLNQIADVLQERPADGDAWYLRLWRRVRDAHQEEAPASLGVPDHSLWAHRNLAAALCGARGEDSEAALLMLHIGPVQGFISTSRRTHDLWMGSYILSYLAYHATHELIQALGPDAIVYPDPGSLVLAEHFLFGEAKQGEQRADLLRAEVPNRLLAIVPFAKAEGLSGNAARRVQEVWVQMGRSVREQFLRPIISRIEPPIDHAEALAHYDEQVAQHLEIEGVIQPWSNSLSVLQGVLTSARVRLELPELVVRAVHDRSGAGYGALFELTTRLLAVQRTLLTPVAVMGDARPKCTQCGAREQMGPTEPRGEAEKFFAKLSQTIQDHDGGRQDSDEERDSLELHRGEGLCAVCLTKRFARRTYFGRRDLLGLSWERREDRRLLRFPSVPTIASAPCRTALMLAASELQPALGCWLDALTDVDRAFHFTPPGDLLPGLPRIEVDSRLREIEGAWLYESSYDPRTAWRNHYSTDVPAEDQATYQGLKARLARARSAFEQVQSHPELALHRSSYYAVVQIDGDKMGEWLSGQHDSTPLLRELNSKIIAELADVRRPLFPALHGEVSRRLGKLSTQIFFDIVEMDNLGRVVYSGGDDLLLLLPLQRLLPCLQAIYAAIRKPEHLGNRFTISAGVCVAHWRDPLGEALHQVSDAEREAKKSRDAFHITLSKRSGEDLNITLPWRLPSGEDLIAALLATLPDPSGDKTSLLGGSVAYRLREEASELKDLRQAFLNRALVELGAKGAAAESPARRAYQLLEALPQPPSELVQLLLLLRFLHREGVTKPEVCS